MRLTSDHISYIVRDLRYQGIVHDELENELTDHIASGVEREMDSGKNFIDAYHQVLRSFGHTSGLRQIQHQTICPENQKPILMLKNYLTIAVRNLRKHRFYSFINIAGLAIGLAACLVMVLFVLHEISYDRHFKNAERIYRVNCEMKFGSTHSKIATVGAALPERLSENFQEIESTVRIIRLWEPAFVKRTNGDGFRESNMALADSSFFKVFSIAVLDGDAKTALKEPNHIVISRKMAEKYFPEGNAAGQSLIIDDKHYQVTAVFEDIPLNSHFHFDIIISMAAFKDATSSILIGGTGFNTYLLLKEGADARKLEGKFPAIVEKYVVPQIAGVAGADFSFEKFLKDGNVWSYSLTPLTDLHLHSNLLGELETPGNITYVYLFSGIALLIMVAACINFMNLSTARSANRAKEVGMRKVMGSLRRHLVRQFLMESFLLMLFSVLIAIVLAHLFIPVFNQLAQKKLAVPFHDPWFYGVLFLTTLVIGFAAGLYPAFFLSAFKPVDILKGRLSQGAKGAAMRSALVVFQFLVSIFLVAVTISINRQLDFIHQKKLGFDKEQVIVVKEAYLLDKKIQAFKDEVMRNSFIKSGSISGYLPVTGTWRGGDTFWKEGTVSVGGNNVDDMLRLEVWNIDHDYLRTLQMEIKEGRGFSSQIASDSTGAILNEEAVKKFGFGKSAVGQRITTIAGRKPDGTPDPAQLKTWTVIGVVKDFHFEPMKQSIRPLVFLLDLSYGNIFFRFEGQNSAAVIETLQKTWKKFAPDQPFAYSFLDEDFGRMYESEERLAIIFSLFAGLAIFIACMGLFALTAFMTEQRTKEIGIRKVLGASVASIVMLISREFGKLIVIAFVMATPFAWYAVTRWLETYTYRTEISWMVYVFSGVLAFFIALLTMGYQSVKAAMENPVKSLKNE